MLLITCLHFTQNCKKSKNCENPIKKNITYKSPSLSNKPTFPPAPDICFAGGPEPAEELRDPDRGGGGGQASSPAQTQERVQPQQQQQQ